MIGKGYVQVYTGNGKGKTTAALGLVMRACGAGLNVLFAQFLKGRECSELEALARFGNQVTVRQYGTGTFVRGKPTDKDRAMAVAGLQEIGEALGSGRYSLIVMDEANVATSHGLITVEALLAVVDAKPEGVEIVITGREAHPKLVERADVVTEMREIKHYHRSGVAARKGIEK